MIGRKFLIAIMASLIFSAPAFCADGANPPPTESEGGLKYRFDAPPGYQAPQTSMPDPRAAMMQYVDLGVLFVAMSLAAWLVHWRRSRRGVVLLMLACLAYFGFYRQGCVCSVGSIQNVAQSLADQSYIIPAAVVGFFILPLAFSLLFGRVFCSSVCPLGAVQDAVLLYPTPLPYWMSRVLGTLPWIYLGLAAMLAATGTAYVICMYDPFIAFFRLGGGVQIFAVGLCVIVIAMFVGRPYCRFVCPYGALLGVCSRVAWKPVSISPGKCVGCGRCVGACPFGAIRPAISDVSAPSPLRRWIVIIALSVALGIAGAWACGGLGVRLAAMNPTVALSDRIKLEDAGTVKEQSRDSRIYRQSGNDIDRLHAAAQEIKDRFDLRATMGGREFVFGWDVLIGAILGVVLAWKISGALRWRPGRTVSPTGGDCVACGRCYQACPVKRKANND